MSHTAEPSNFEMPVHNIRKLWSLAKMLVSLKQCRDLKRQCYHFEGRSYQAKGRDKDDGFIAA